MAQLLNNINVWLVLYCEHQLLGVEKKTFLHLSLGKAGPFTLESHICVKALKCTDSQIIRCIIKPLLKTTPKQFSKGVPHEWLSYSKIYNCLGGTLLWAPTVGSEKKQNPFSTFLWVKLVPLL